MVKKLITEDTRMFLTGNETIAYAANAAEAEFYVRLSYYTAKRNHAYLV